MAKPRVFLSSTFYDLRHVRGELERFIRDMGYEPILNERGQVTYGSAEALEKYCYREVEKASMLVSIVGGRFGSASKDNDQYSISNMELKAAIKQGKQVYIFIESGVHSEYRTYLKNKKAKIEYHHADDVRIYNFIEEIYALPLNNQISSFSDIPEITTYLKEQWAGLLDLFLQEKSQEQIARITDTIQSTAQTLKDLVELLRDDRLGLMSSVEGREKTLDALILQNHPIFVQMRSELKVPYRVFFTNITEMEEWLQGRSLTKVDAELHDSEAELEYFWGREGSRRLLYVTKNAFDENGSLKAILPGNDDKKFVRSIKVAEPAPTDDDEIPF